MQTQPDNLHLYKQSDQTGQQGLISKSQPVSVSAGSKDALKAPRGQQQLNKQDFVKAADSAEVYSWRLGDGRRWHA